ncbi:MAG: hypothetical protein V3S27_06545, partial [Kiloniellales bacterium]
PLVLAFGLLISAIQILAAVGQAAAQAAAQDTAQDWERVAVRVGEHPGFSRIVFDWRRPVGVRLEQVDGNTLLRFDRVATLDLEAFRADPPPEVSRMEAAVAGGELLVTLTTIPGAKTRIFESEGKTVLDVLRPETSAGAKAATPQAWRRSKAQKAAGKPARAPAGTPAQTRPDAAKQTAAVAKSAASVESAVPPKSPLPAISEPISLLPPALDSVTTDPGQAPALVGKDGSGAAKASAATRVTARKSTPKPKAKPAITPATTGQTASAATDRGATPRQAPAARPKAVAAENGETPTASAIMAAGSLVPSGTVSVLIDTSPLPGKTLLLGQRRSLRFEWPAEAVPAAAAFRRDGNLWLVFDRPPPGDLAGEIAKAAPELEPVAQFEVDGATVIRFTAPGLLMPRMRREDSAWILDLVPGASRFETTIEMLVEGAPGQVRISFPVEAPGRIVSFIDPERGDRLIVAPLSGVGPGIPVDREFPQFRTLASLQGLVVQPLSETLRVTVTPKAVELRDDEGLIVSRGGSLALLKSNQPAPRRGTRLFDLVSWRRGDTARFVANKHALIRAIAAAGPDRIESARLELAKFYFAHGLSTEALSMVRLSQAQDSQTALDPRARLITAVAEFMTDDYTTAAAYLFHPALAGEWEADLWRAALAAASQDWDLAAAGFAAAVELIDAYPHVVRARLRLLAAEASLAVGDRKAAEHHLEAVRLDNPSHAQEAQIAYLVARGLYLEGDTESAAALWRRVVASKHASSRIRARLALLDLALEDGSISTDGAIEKLERLRFAWRGDRFEFALLQRLGDLYILKGEHRAGLRLLRRAATHTPNAELAAAVATRMRNVFTELFRESNTELPPLQALTLFEEFKELTPPGEAGDAVILNLAERLVDIDLLDRAAGVIEAQVQFRLKGVARARVAARLARIRLLGQKPNQALQALDISELPDLPAELTLVRHRLRAQALLDLKREEAALAALGAADDPETLRLRARILSRQKNWPAAALALERLVPEAPPEVRPLREDESKAVVDLLVALTMADDRDRIDSLGRTYQEAMSRGPHAKTFQLLVGDPRAAREKSVAEELAGVADVEAFMASYRENTRPLGAAEKR